jgi:hypothetical protein
LNQKLEMFTGDGRIAVCVTSMFAEEPVIIVDEKSKNGKGEWYQRPWRLSDGANRTTINLRCLADVR